MSQQCGAVPLSYRSGGTYRWGLKTNVFSLTLKGIVEMDNRNLRLERLKVEVMQYLEHHTGLGLMDGCWKPSMPQELLTWMVSGQLQNWILMW
jgi:hypothetical protein